MKKIFWILLFSLFAFACSKDLPAPQLTCGPNKNLEGLWISDSVRDIYVDSNSTVIWDITSVSSYPQDYQKFDFFCINNTPTFFGEQYQNYIPTTTHDTSSYHFVWSIIYYAPPSITDTSQMARKYLEYLAPKKLVLRWTGYQTNKGRDDIYYYMRK